MRVQLLAVFLIDMPELISSCEHPVCSTNVFTVHQALSQEIDAGVAWKLGFE